MKCTYCRKKIKETEEWQQIALSVVHKNCLNDFIQHHIKKTKRKKVKTDWEKQKKENQKSGSKKMAWSRAFSPFIRKRDEKEPCISCRIHKKVYHAGHYIPKSRGEQYYFNEDNVHKQCAYCNVFLSGNLANYRINLTKKIGLEKVKELEKLKPLKEKRGVEDYKKINKKYRLKLKEL